MMMTDDDDDGDDGGGVERDELPRRLTCFTAYDHQDRPSSMGAFLKLSSSMRYRLRQAVADQLGLEAPYPRIRNHLINDLWPSSTGITRLLRETFYASSSHGYSGDTRRLTTTSF